MFTEDKREPAFYKVKPQDKGETSNTEEESCLATRFTVQNATNDVWPLKDHKTDAVRFEGEGYYSRLLLDITNCNETGKNL